MLKIRLSGRAMRWLRAAAWLIALAVCAMVAASLLARLIEPRRVEAVAAGTADPLQAARQIVARSPFATDAPQQASAETPREAQDYILVGVATGFGPAPGFAMLQSRAGAVISVTAGETIAPGLVLAAIHARHVEIARNGARETLTLAQGTATTVLPDSPAMPNPANQR